jgi:hypothetical protein
MVSTVGAGVGDLWIPLCVPPLVMVLTMVMAWIEGRLLGRRPRRVRGGAAQAAGTGTGEPFGVEVPAIAEIPPRGPPVPGPGPAAAVLAEDQG